MAVLEISSVWFGTGKTGKVSFTRDPDKQFGVWADAPFKDALRVGATADATFKHEPEKQDANGKTWPASDFLQSWDGVSMPDRPPKPRGGGFGGGGRSYTPKSPEEIHASSIAGIIKSCLESQTPLSSAAAWLDLYDKNARAK